MPKKTLKKVHKNQLLKSSDNFFVQRKHLDDPLARTAHPFKMNRKKHNHHSQPPMVPHPSPYLSWAWESAEYHEFVKKMVDLMNNHL